MHHEDPAARFDDVSETARVLIVEDDPELAENLAELLQELGVASDVAPSAEQGLALLGERRYCGVLSDYRLPAMNGVDLIREMRARLIGSPVLLVSGFLDHRMAADAEKAGALDVLVKPVNLTRLAEYIDELRSPSASVLVVEDDADLRENLLEALEARGLSTAQARTAKQALGLKKLPHMAIVDLNLPDQDGIDVARRLALRDPRIRILFVSGYTETYIERLRAVSGELQPVDDKLWVNKPCDVAKLAQRLSRAAERR